MKHEKFAERLNQACDDVSSVIPAHGQGRLVVLAKKLDVSQEAVRRWFAGEARPRVAKMQELAAVLNVDEAWLSLGVKADMRPSERKFFAKGTSAMGNLAYNFAQLEEGVHCSTPDDKDPRKGIVDFYLMAHGKQAAVRVAMGLPAGRDSYDFILPRAFAQVKNVGMMASLQSAPVVLNFDDAMIEKHGELVGEEYKLTVKKKADKFMSGRDEWKLLKTFGELA